MKRVIVAVLILSVTLAAFLCAAVYAEENLPEADGQNIYLVNPSSLAYANGSLYISDNVTESRCVIHKIDVSGSVPFYVSGSEIDGNVINLAYGDTLYAVMSNKIVTPLADKPPVGVAAADAAYSQEKLYYLSDGTLYERNCETGRDVSRDNTAVNAKALCVTDSYVYYLYGNTWATLEIATGGQTSRVAVENYAPKGIFALDSGSAALFSDSGVYTAAADSALLFEIQSGNRIIDAAGGENAVYVLNGENKVVKYQKSGGGYTLTEGYEIGSDEVNYAVPDMADFASFTLAQSNGYPANIVYKTADSSTSVPTLIDSLGEKTFIIIGYDGDRNCDYYYVFVDNAFGWIKKSASNAAGDSKITVIATELDGMSSFEAKLMTANAAYIYHLPVASESKTNFLKQTVTQSADNPITVSLLQKFTASDGVEWYYVNYGGKTGFVQTADVGRIYSTGLKDDVLLQGGDKKINATLFDSVSVFLTEEMKEGEFTTDKVSGERLKLASGTIVKIVQKGENACFVQIVNSDGTTHEGWVASSYLINPDALTTNAIVGLSLLGAAVIIAAVFAVVFAKRKKNAQNNDIIIE